MNVMDAIMQRRTIRKFQQKALPKELLYSVIDAATVAACGNNLQPLRYEIITDKKLRDEVFATTKWAASLPDGTPKEDERPMAYIIVYADERIKKECAVDAGSAIANMMLAAWSQGIGSCWLGSVDRPALRSILETPEHLQLLYVLALGYPAQESVAEAVKDSCRYYEDENGIIHVPKLSRQQVLIQER